MTNKEMAVQLTIKAIEFGLIQAKPANHCKAEDQYAEATQVAAQQVSEFYKSMVHTLSST